MNKYVLGAVAILLSLNASAQQVPLTWAKSIGGSFGNDIIQSVYVDAAGNVYVAGSFFGSADFDPSSSTLIKSSLGATDAFFAKYTSAGALVWVDQLGSTAGDDEVYAITADAAGNVYVAGYFSGSVDFDPGASSSTLTSAGGFDLFFGKYTSAGALVWANKTGSANNDIAVSIAVDASSNVYVAGAYTLTADFDFSAGVMNKTSLGGFDIFVGKYTSTGGLSWINSIGSTGDDQGLSITLVGANVWLGGSYSAEMDMDPSASTSSATNLGLQDGFFASYSTAAGAVGAWGTIRSTGKDIVTSLWSDGTNLYSAGQFSGSASLFGASGNQSRTSNGGTDMFIAKHVISSFNISWLSAFGGTADDGVNLIFGDASSNIYATGSYNGTVDFNATSGVQSLTSAGSEDGFLTKYNSDGSFGWAFSLGGSTGDDTGTSCAVDASGGIYVAGAYNGSMIADPGVGSTTLTSTGSWDGYFARYLPATLATEPTAQPTNLVVVARNSTDFTYDITAASGVTGGYLHVYREGSAPTSLPSDGVEYSSGDVFPDGSIVKYSDNIPAGNSYEGLTPATSYFIRVYSYNGDGAARNYLTTNPLGQTITTLATEPTNSPTGLNFTSVTSTGYNYNFTAAAAGAAAPDGYLIIKRAASAPTGVPVDGTVYTAGSNLGDGNIRFVGALPGGGFSETGETASTTYHFAVYSYRGSGVAINYKQDAPLINNVTTSSSSGSEPSAQPSGFNFTSATATGYTVSFVAPATPPAGYIAVRRQGASAPTTDPVDGTSYTVGSTLGDGIIAFVGTGTSFNETGLTSATQYTYKIYAFNGSGSTINYLQISPLVGSANTTGGTLATEPGASPTALSFTNVSATGFTGNFVAPSPAPQGYIVIAAASTTTPTNQPVDGVAYVFAQNLGGAFVIYVGANTTFSVTWNAATTYSLAVYAFNGSGSTTNYRLALPATASVTTLALEPTAQPTAFVPSAQTNTSGTVSFTAASGSPAGYIALRKAGSVATSTPVDGTVYTAGQVLGDATVAYVGSGVTFNETGLTSGTTYHYTIFSFNGSALSSNYLLTSPLTGTLTTTSGISEPTAQPTNLTFPSVGTNSFSLQFVAAAGAPAGYIGISSTGTPEPPVDGETYVAGQSHGSDSFVSFLGTQTSYNITGVAPETTYYFAVYAYNGSGSAINYRQASPLTNNVTTLPITDTTPPVMSGNTTPLKVSPGQTVKVSATWQDPDSQVYWVEIDYGPTNAEDWTAVDEPMTNVSGNIWEFTIPSNAIGELGVEYRMTAYNLADLTTDSDFLRVAVEHTGAGLTIPYSSFGEGQTNYRIISVPLVLDKKSVNDVFSAKLGAYDPKKWRMFRYSGGYRELSGTSTIDIGQGYMFISKENKGSLTTGSGTTLDVGISKPLTFTPANGWNLIGNPFNFNLNWTDVQSANSSISGVPLKTYSGGTGFVTSTTLPVFSGGFVFVNSTTPITIPHVKSGRAAEQLPEINHALDEEQWTVNLSLSSGDLKTEGGFGMSHNASPDYDQLDDFTLPRFFDYLELNHSKKVHGSFMAKDIVPTANEHEWEFVIESNGPEESVTLSWDNTYFGTSEKQLVLWDESEQRSVDMRLNNSYSFRQQGSNPFRVYFGSPDFVRQKARPSRVTFHSVHPIPASSKVTFAFSTPQNAMDENTSLEVYNLMGQKIANLVNGRIEPGYHEVVWSIDQGQKLQSGMYIGILRHGNALLQQKLIID